MTAAFFFDDEAGYLNWLENHPQGYVVNTTRARSPNYMVLHHARCRKISEYNRMAQPGGFTERQYAKACAATVEELAEWVKQHGRPDGTFSRVCRLCNPV